MFAPKRVVITGGAGFVGSHLCDRFVADGADVVCVDNLLTGRRRNVEHLLDSDRFTYVEADVSRGVEVPGEVDAVLHFASPASPIDYQKLPIETMRAGLRHGTAQVAGEVTIDGRSLYKIELPGGITGYFDKPDYRPVFVDNPQNTGSQPTGWTAKLHRG